MRGVETREQGIENPKRSKSRWVVEDQEKEERKGARFSKWGREMRRSGQDKVGKRTKFEQQGSLRHNSDSGKYSQCFTFSTFCHNRALFQNGFNNFFSPSKFYALNCAHRDLQSSRNISAPYTRFMPQDNPVLDVYRQSLCLHAWFVLRCNVMCTATCGPLYRQTNLWNRPQES